MTPIAVGLFVVSATMLWGGLVWSLLRLRKHPDIPEGDEGTPST